MDEAAARTNDVAAFLGRHDIVASAQVLQGDDGARSSQILKFADEHQAGLIVAGGYGHARMREWVLGGVTHGLLGASRSACCSAIDPGASRITIVGDGARLVDLRAGRFRDVGRIVP